MGLPRGKGYLVFVGLGREEKETSREGGRKRLMGGSRTLEITKLLSTEWGN